MTFEQDKEATPVLFRVSEGEVTAVLPCEPANYDGYSMTCYAHVGQHGACSPAWYNTTRAAKPEEYATLRRELEGAPYGYRLVVYKRIQPWMRKAFAAKDGTISEQLASRVTL